MTFRTEFEARGVQTPEKYGTELERHVGGSFPTTYEGQSSENRIQRLEYVGCSSGRSAAVTRTFVINGCFRELAVSDTHGELGGHSDLSGARTNSAVHEAIES